MNACLPDLHAHVMDALYLLNLVRGPKVLKGTKGTKDTKVIKEMWVNHHNVGNASTTMVPLVLLALYLEPRLMRTLIALQQEMELLNLQTQ